jgi:hypothetical protein
VGNLKRELLVCVTSPIDERPDRVLSLALLCQFRPVQVSRVLIAVVSTIHPSRGLKADTSCAKEFKGSGTMPKDRAGPIQTKTKPTCLERVWYVGKSGEITTNLPMEL